MKRPERDEHVNDKAQDRRRAPYEPPTLEVFRDEEILDLVGPAQTYSGPAPGTSGGGSF